MNSTPEQLRFASIPSCTSHTNFQSGVFGCVAELRTAIRQFIDAHNNYSAKPFRWTESAETIIAKVQSAKLSVTNNE